MRNLKLRYLVLTIFLIVGGIGCDNSSGPDEDDNGNPAVVEGRVDTLGSNQQVGDPAQNKFKQVEGAVVKAARVNAEGNLEALGEDSAETNAEGEFSLEINAGGLNDVSDRIVITAEREGNMAKTFVSSTVEQGGTVRAKPLSVESTSEATIYQQLLAQGNMNQVTTADIEVVVNEPVGLDVNQDSTLAGVVASALVAGEQAQEEFYSSQGVDVPQEQRDDISSIEVEAQQELENRLSTSNEAGFPDAYESFYETYATAEMEGGVSPANAAKSMEVRSRVIVNQLSVLSDTAQIEVRTDAAYNKTYSLEAGVLEQFEHLNVSQQGIDNIEQAAETARSDIRELEGEVTEEDVRPIFETFQQEVIAVINDEGDLNGELFSAVHASINDMGGAKATLETSLEGSTDVLSVMNAYNQFYSDVQNVVSGSFDDVVEAGVDEFYTELLILINAPA